MDSLLGGPSDAKSIAKKLTDAQKFWLNRAPDRQEWGNWPMSGGPAGCVRRLISAGLVQGSKSRASFWLTDLGREVRAALREQD